MTRVSLLAAALLAAGCATPRDTATVTASAPARTAQGTIEVVVANQRSASASIMSADGSAMKHVHVGDGPHEAAVSPDGRTAVVTIYGVQGAPGNRLAVIDLVRDTVVRTIDLGVYTRPHGVVFLGTSSSRIAVTSESTNNVVIVDLASGAVEPVPTNARGSHMVAVDATGTRGWTANIADANVSELDLANRRFVRSFAVPTRPEGIAVTPDGSEVWVGSNDTGEVTVIDTRTGAVAATLTGARFPYRLGTSPDGSRMAVVDAMGSRLWIADVRSRSWAGGIDLAHPRGVVIAADNRTAYVTLAEGMLAVVDIVDMTVRGTMAVESSPDGVGTGVRR